MNNFRTGIQPTSSFWGPMLVTLTLTALPSLPISPITPANINERYSYGRMTETSSIYRQQDSFTASIEGALRMLAETVIASQINSDFEIDNIIADNINELYQYGF